MATFYVDFENGNDANNGTTFAQRWKTLTNGATAARIAPGDEIRIMGSPAPTSLGQNGVWTSQALQGTKNISSSTNATPISITCNSHGYSTGDTVVITGHATNTNANGTWEITVTGANTFTLDGSSGNATGSGGTVRLRNNTRVMLTTAVTQNIASTGPGRAAWTSGQANVSTGFDTANFKEGRQSDQIIFNTGSTTGLIAYWAMPTPLDLSSYQQISFWIRNETTSAITAGMLELRLCSDSAGVTAVNTFSIPAVVGTSRWQVFTLNNQANLGSAVQSIAIYAMSAPGTPSLRLNNIIACKASSDPDSLTLTSLIGKNTTGETFWGIQSINGRRVMLDADTNATPTSTTVRGYYGTSETVTTWKRETIKLGPAAASTTALQTIQDSGTDGSPITFSGGWDRTNMSTQTLETWLDGQNGNGYGISASSQSWLVIQKISASRFGIPISVGTGDSNRYTLGALTNSTSGAINQEASTRSAEITLDFIAACETRGFLKSTSLTVNGSIKINNGIISCNGNALVLSLGKYVVYGVSGQTLIANNAAAAVSQTGCETWIRNIKTENNAGGGISSAGAAAYLVNCEINDATEVAITAYSDFAVQSHNHDNTAGNHKIFGDGYLISAATDQRKTASGISWKIQPTVIVRINSFRPATLSLAKVAVAANSLVTVKAWMRRDNSGLTMRLVCKGGQIAGVANDVTASVTTTNAWEEETITFTPTETGVVEITAEAWGGTTFSGWVDDMTISQA